MDIDSIRASCIYSTESCRLKFLCFATLSTTKTSMRATLPRSIRSLLCPSKIIKKRKLLWHTFQACGWGHAWECRCDGDNGQSLWASVKDTRNIATYGSHLHFSKKASNKTALKVLRADSLEPLRKEHPNKLLHKSALQLFLHRNFHSLFMSLISGHHSREIFWSNVRAQSHHLPSFTAAHSPQLHSFPIFC